MNVTVLGAGNSGLAMAAHLSLYGNKVRLWNRSKENIAKIMETGTIYCEGVICGNGKINLVTSDIALALEGTDLVLVATPANSHRDLAKLVAENLKESVLIVLNPGRTFGAIEFKKVFSAYNTRSEPLVAETQTTIYTCRKTGEDSIHVIALKDSVLLSALDASLNESIIQMLPECIRRYFVPAKSLVETSIGNVGMILHCAPLLLNAGWTENKDNIYKYYYDGITPTIAQFLEEIDRERITVSEKLGLRVESTQDWLKRTYGVKGRNLYECIQNNDAYKHIEAPSSLQHRYIYEDIPFGLVPLESIGHTLGLSMSNTTLIIDLACRLLGVDFRREGRTLDYLSENSDVLTYLSPAERSDAHGA